MDALSHAAAEAVAGYVSASSVCLILEHRRAIATGTLVATPGGRRAMLTAAHNMDDLTAPIRVLVARARDSSKPFAPEVLRHPDPKVSARFLSRSGRLAGASSPCASCAQYDGSVPAFYGRPEPAPLLLEEMRRIPRGKQRCIVVVGCGAGIDALAIAARRSGLVHGIDVDRRMVEAAEAHRLLLGFKRVRFHRASVATWLGKVAPGSVDALIDTIGFHNFLPTGPQAKAMAVRLLRLYARALRPGAPWLLTVRRDHENVRVPGAGLIDAPVAQFFRFGLAKRVAVREFDRRLQPVRFEAYQAVGVRLPG